MRVITKSPAFENFSEAIKSPSTRVTYTRSLNEFMRFIKISDFEVLANEDPETITNQLVSWVSRLKKRELKKGSISTKLNAVELFLDMNKRVWFRKIVRKSLPSGDYIPGGERPFTDDEVFKILSACSNLREKCIVLYFANTGARPASIIDPNPLRVGDLKELENCYAIEIYDDSKERYWSFLSPEARKTFDSYIESRRKSGEKITDDSPLFHNIGNNATTTNLNLSNLYRLIRKLLKKADIERTKTGKRFDIALIYGLRKRFNGILKMNNAVNSNIAEKLMAHKNGLDGHYLKPKLEESFEEFKKAIPELTIDPNKRHEAEIKKVRQEKDVKKEDMENLRKEFKQTLKGMVYLFMENQSNRPDKKPVSIEELEKIMKDPKFYDNIDEEWLSGK